MYVRALQPHRGTGRRREPGEVYILDDVNARTLLKAGLVAAVGEAAVPDWYAREGRELRVTAARPSGRPVVACLSIWNDLPALKLTWDSWAPYVDGVVVFDGPQRMSDGWGSTDGLRDWLPDGALHVEGEWQDQRAKRTALLQYAAAQYPEALLFIVDADELVENGEALRSLPDCEVGWVTMTTRSIYGRRYGQPRVVRAARDLEYRGRHHWLYRGDRLLATHQYGGAGVLHRLTGLSVVNNRGRGQSAERAAAKRRGAVRQFPAEAAAVTSDAARASDEQTGARESLRVLQLGPTDAGMVAYRLHTALNATTPHAALLATFHASNPYAAPVGYDLGADWAMAQALFDEADVVHCHLNYAPLAWLERLGKVAGKWVVIHHHGTMYRSKPGPAHYNAMDASWARLRLVSNLELLQYGEGLHWLPNPMPVAEYRALRARHGGLEGQRPFRVAHSPSKRELKGTERFLATCERLNARGVAIEPVLIEGLSHAESLARKATCDAAFDSFWLGMQCSGLEAAAMGLPVVAGAYDQEAGYRALGLAGAPYTRADTEAALEAALEALATDTAHRAAEGARVGAFVEAWHDEAAVALRYLNLLDGAVAWRERMRVGTVRPEPEVEVAPAPLHVKPRKPKRQRPKTPETPAVPAPETREVGV